jgi:predicted O-methyltransferase YrrM
MIAQERLIDYLHSLEPEQTGVLEEIRQEAIRDYVPIIRQETGSLLKTLVSMHKPKKILEVGTAVGYSALLMSEVMPEGCTITTIEKYEKRIPIALENFKRAGKSSSIQLLEGDAMQILENLEGTFDFIFMDAAKGQYIHFLPAVMRLLSVGGVLVSDNVLQDGELLESRFGVTRRNRTIHSRMREYLYQLKHMEEFETSILPVGDGVTISVRKK